MALGAEGLEHRSPRRRGIAFQRLIALDGGQIGGHQLGLDTRVGIIESLDLCRHIGALIRTDKALRMA